LPALLAVYVFWGTTAPALHVMVTSVPPFAGASMRFLAAGAALFVWVRSRRIPLPTRADAIGAIVSGTLLLGMSNGLFTWSMQYLPGGLGSIFFALSPLWMVLLAWLLYAERPRKRSLAGVAIGFAGILLVISPASGVHLPPWPTAVALVSSVTWSLGSIVERRFKKSDLVQASALALLTAGVELAAVSALVREPIVPDRWTASSLAALAYLIVFGSIVGFSAYLWLMRHVRTAVAATYSYVNPVVAIGVAIVLLGERLSVTAGFGAAVVLAGVALMMSAPPVDVEEPAEVG
jgi:drug/metabolite transporter (DMT)-like permease